MDSFLSLRRRRLALPGCILILSVLIYIFRDQSHHGRAVF